MFLDLFFCFTDGPKAIIKKSSLILSWKFTCHPKIEEPVGETFWMVGNQEQLINHQACSMSLFKKNIKRNRKV